MNDPKEETPEVNDRAAPDLLEQVQADSEKQALPEQEKVFRVARRIRSRLTNLPDPTHAPLGFVPGRGYDVVFPFIRLPELRPTLNGDWVQFGSPELEPNLLYYGDNLQVLRTLPSESIDLIYIDPPFFSGEEYNVIWGDANEVRTFNDIWDGGLDTYLIWLNARLWEMCRVLKSSGSIFIHCDWHASHYIKAEMDKIFGYENFRNEISWYYYNKMHDRRKGQLPNAFDILLFYSKTENCKYSHLTEKREHPTRQLVRKKVAGRMVNARDANGNVLYRESTERMIDNVWRIPCLQPADNIERGGYPTQKPLEVVQRVIEIASEPGDIVADFFCGGGAFVAAAAGVRAHRDTEGRKILAADAAGRRWIACDISRVAISVTLDRLVKIYEEQSGVKSNYSKPGSKEFQLKLPEVRAKVPDIRVVYVGVYAMDRFKSVEQNDFERFVLQCFDCRLDTSEEPISGWRTQLEPVSVGPADPEKAPEPAAVKAFFEVCLPHLQPNTKMRARVLAWKFSPQLMEYRKQLLAYIDKNLRPRGVPMEFDYVPINSQQFRERIIRKYPEASDNEFFLRFTQPPIVGGIKAKRIAPRKYRFEAVDTYSANLDGYLVNSQWDFDFQRGHFAAHPDYVLGRKETKGREAKEQGHKFEAVLAAEHQFEKSGVFTVACGVQDNLGGETIKAVEVEVEG